MYVCSFDECIRAWNHHKSTLTRTHTPNPSTQQAAQGRVAGAGHADPPLPGCLHARRGQRDRGCVFDLPYHIYAFVRVGIDWSALSLLAVVRLIAILKTTDPNTPNTTPITTEATQIKNDGGSAASLAAGRMWWSFPALLCDIVFLSWIYMSLVTMMKVKGLLVSLVWVEIDRSPPPPPPQHTHTTRLEIDRSLAPSFPHTTQPTPPITPTDPAGAERDVQAGDVPQALLHHRLLRHPLRGADRRGATRARRVRWRVVG